MLREALPEPQGPGPAVIAKGRDLLNADRPGGRRGTWRRHRAGWTAGIAATAVAATALVIILDPQDQAKEPGRPVTAHQILLAAATMTVATSEGEGRYRRVRTKYGRVLPVSSSGRAYRMMSTRVDDLWYPNAPGVAGRYTHQELGAS